MALLTDCEKQERDPTGGALEAMSPREDESKEEDRYVDNDGRNSDISALAEAHRFGAGSEVFKFLDAALI